jgi:hypothetical protein
MEKKSDRPATDFTALAFLIRFIAALALVLITFNPSGHSAYHWIVDAVSEGRFGPLYLLLIAALLVGWAILWVATARSLNAFGVILTALVLGAIVWLFIDWGMLKADSVSSVTWIVLVCLAAVLAVGLSWSHLWRRMTGQVNVEHVDD